MLPKGNRLVKESDFKEVAKRAKPIHSQFFILKKISSLQQDTAFGLVLSAQVSKKAVVRNKIRRRTREILRPLLPVIKPGFKVMLMVKISIIDKNFQEIKNDLEDLLKKSGLI